VQRRRRSDGDFFDIAVGQNLLEAARLMHGGVIGLITVERRLILIAERVQRAEQVEIAGEIFTPVARANQREITGDVLVIHIFVVGLAA